LTVARHRRLRVERLSARAAALGEEDQQPTLSAYLEQRRTTATDELARTLAELGDVRALLTDAGLSERDVGRLRRRLLDR
jgi:hypothetical protein